MKIRSLLTVVAMLSVFLFAIGTAYAVTGVADDVPGADIVIPIICEGHHDAGGGDPVFGSLNTVWAIADKSPSSETSCDIIDSVCVPHGGGVGAVFTDVFVKDSTSITRLDTSECWSPQDVISSDCQSLITLMSNSDQASMEVTVNGVTYFAGYVIYSQSDWCDDFTNRFVSWVYLNDVTKGFATGFNGISIENGLFNPANNPNNGLSESCNVGSCGGDEVGISARTVLPRYFILNNNADTFNWWIFLLGRNAYNFGVSNVFTRKLACFICDEEENCFSKDILIPLELNIINVAGNLPGGLFPPTTFPKAGFAFCDVKESGFLPGNAVATSITGTMSFDDDASDDPEVYSLFGWAYQRAVPVSSPAKVSVVHPIHRTYCMHHGTPTLGHSDDLPNRFEDDDQTAGRCWINGPLPDGNVATDTN